MNKGRVAKWFFILFFAMSALTGCHWHHHYHGHYYDHGGYHGDYHNHGGYYYGH